MQNDESRFPKFSIAPMDCEICGEEAQSGLCPKCYREKIASSGIDKNIQTYVTANQEFIEGTPIRFLDLPRYHPSMYKSGETSSVEVLFIDMGDFPKGPFGKDDPAAPDGASDES